MIEALLSLIPGGVGTALVACISAVLLAIWRIFATGKTAGINQERAKEADAYERHIKEIERAADARPDRELRDDPHNRDTW